MKKACRNILNEIGPSNSVDRFKALLSIKIVIDVPGKVLKRCATIFGNERTLTCRRGQVVTAGTSIDAGTGA